MSDHAAQLRARLDQIKKIGAKIKRGAALTADDQAFLNPESNQSPIALRPVYDSMGAAAGALGVPKKLLTAAKNAGVLGFDGATRVRTYELLPSLVQWLYATGGLSKAEAKKQAIEDERHRKYKEDNDRKAGLTLPKAPTLEAVKQLGQRQKAMLRTVLEDDLPPLLAHKEPAAIRVHMKETVDKISRLMTELQL